MWSILTSIRTVGLALAADRLIAYVPERSSTAPGKAWERPVRPLTAAEGHADLAAALIELRQELGVSRGRTSIALLPDLVQLKRIELPKMRESELRAVVTRDGAMFFFGAHDAQVVAFERLATGRTPMIPLMVACTPELVIDGVITAALEAGWALDRIVPAHTAWAVAAVRRCPRLHRGGAEVVVTLGTVRYTLRLSDGRLDLVRRAPTSTSAATETPLVQLDEPALVAAMHVGSVRALEMLPERLHVQRARRTRSVARSLVAVAAASLVASAGLELWGTQRELQQVESRRAAIRARVNGIMRVRDALDVVDRRTTTLVTLDRTAPQWSGTMATVASHLPLDAHLAAFRGRADSLVLEGTAERAAPVFEAIQRAPGVNGVRATAPIRQELDGEQRPVEHFAVALRLAQAGTAAGEKP